MHLMRYTPVQLSMNEAFWANVSRPLGHGKDGPTMSSMHGRVPLALLGFIQTIPEVTTTSCMLPCHLAHLYCNPSSIALVLIEC
eukprot:3023543-Amphidinium_carterae.1